MSNNILNTQMLNILQVSKLRIARIEFLEVYDKLGLAKVR